MVLATTPTNPPEGQSHAAIAPHLYPKEVIMRIRTTRQAREIRKGIMLARDPRPITTEDIGGHLYQFPLMQRAYTRTKNKPPRGIDGLTRRAHNEGGSIVQKVSKDQVFFAPIGTDPSDQSQWQPIGYLQNGGVTFDEGTEQIKHYSGDTIRTINNGGYFHDDGQLIKTGSIVQQAINFTIAHSHPYQKLLFGIYRLPGDKPLIHKGGKP